MLETVQQAAWIAAFVFVVAVVGLSAMKGSTQSPPQQNAQSKHQPSDQQHASSPNTESDKSHESKGWAKYKEKIERNEKIITAVSTAFIAAFTVVLAFATGFLFFATRDLVKGAEETAERQLRAYISVTAGHVRLINNTTAVEMWVQFKNAGQTPAYKFGNWLRYEIKLAGSPMPAIPRERDSSETSSILLPGQTADVVLRSELAPQDTPESMQKRERLLSFGAGLIMSMRSRKNVSCCSVLCRDRKLASVRGLSARTRSGTTQTSKDKMSAACHSQR
jgi:hypothetical protein